ncbi:MAG TPA: hypothetical protein VMZ31_19750 [Phycisphaerae bacterium]|nr:hypothetical protein [Phycisphaerae bacterium]
MARSARWIVPVAVAAGVALVIGLWPSSGNGGRAYAMSDVSGLLRRARTVHLKGVCYEYVDMADSTQFKRQVVESWFDVEAGRTWQRSTRFDGDSANAPCEDVETIRDGEYTMLINHTARSVQFDRINPYLRRIQTRQGLEGMLKQMLGDPKQVDTFRLTGQDQVDGMVFDVWERKVIVDPDVLNLKVRWWLAPSSGEVGRVETWLQVLPVGEDWRLQLRIELLERDATPPASLFTSEPPADYAVAKAKEDTSIPELDVEAGVRTNNLEFDARIAFVMPDGSVVLAWQGFDHKATASQAELFAGLAIGGPLPKLPVEAYALGQAGGDGGATHIGRHLAVTQKDGKFVEWSLYVATDPATSSRADMQMYRVLIRYNPLERKVSGRMLPGLHALLAVDSADDFDELVLGAMGELSDGGAAPAHVDYEQVLALAERIRASQTSQAHDPAGH